jgi:hypothetical protein
LSSVDKLINRGGGERCEDVNRGITWWTNETIAESVGLVIIKMKIIRFATIVVGGITIIMELNEADGVGGGRFVGISLMEAIDKFWSMLNVSSRLPGIFLPRVSFPMHQVFQLVPTSL